MFRKQVFRKAGNEISCKSIACGSRIHRIYLVSRLVQCRAFGIKKSSVFSEGQHNGSMRIKTVKLIKNLRRLLFKLIRNGEPFILTPLHLVWNGDYYYVVGVFDYKQEIGSFRVDRIAQCPVILDDPALAPPADFDINEYLNTAFRMYNSDQCNVELICDNSVMDSIIDRFGADVTTYANDMTSFRAIVHVATSHIFYSWVFSFGGLVRIKGPVEVKNAYAEMVKVAAKEIVNEFQEQ